MNAQGMSDVIHTEVAFPREPRGNERDDTDRKRYRLRFFVIQIPLMHLLIMFLILSMFSLACNDRDSGGNLAGT